MKSRKHITIFLQGMAVIVPVLVTLYVCGYALYWLDNNVRMLLQKVIKVDAPGVGVAAGLATIYIVGLLTRSLLFRKVGRLGERVVQSIPLVKSLYSAVKDMMQFVGGAEPAARGVPARLNLMDGQVHMLGIVTQKQPARHLGEAEEGRVAIYLPMSIQIGGFTLYVPEEKVELLEDMEVETAMKLAMTAGVGNQTEDLASALQQEQIEEAPQDEASS